MISKLGWRPLTSKTLKIKFSAPKLFKKLIFKGVSKVGFPKKVLVRIGDFAQEFNANVNDYENMVININ